MIIIPSIKKQMTIKLTLDQIKDLNQIVSSCYLIFLHDLVIPSKHFIIFTILKFTQNQVLKIGVSIKPNCS